MRSQSTALGTAPDPVARTSRAGDVRGRGDRAGRSGCRIAGGWEQGGATSTCSSAARPPARCHLGGGGPARRRGRGPSRARTELPTLRVHQKPGPWPGSRASWPTRPAIDVGYRDDGHDSGGAAIRDDEDNDCASRISRSTVKLGHRPRMARRRARARARAQRATGVVAAVSKGWRERKQGRNRKASERTACRQPDDQARGIDPRDAEAGASRSAGGRVTLPALIAHAYKLHRAEIRDRRRGCLVARPQGLPSAPSRRCGPTSRARWWRCAGARRRRSAPRDLGATGLYRAATDGRC